MKEAEFKARMKEMELIRKQLNRIVESDEDYDEYRRYVYMIPMEDIDKIFDTRKRKLLDHDY